MPTIDFKFIACYLRPHCCFFFRRSVYYTLTSTVVTRWLRPHSRGYCCDWAVYSWGVGACSGLRSEENLRWMSEQKPVNLYLLRSLASSPGTLFSWIDYINAGKWLKYLFFCLLSTLGIRKIASVDLCLKIVQVFTSCSRIPLTSRWLMPLKGEAFSSTLSVLLVIRTDVNLILRILAMRLFYWDSSVKGPRISLNFLSLFM